MIIQFSPIRSGSTLIYNYLRKLGKNPSKIHKYRNISGSRYIITIRHPYNSIISSILRKDENISDEILIDNINEYLNNGGNCIVNNNLDGLNHCDLIYENFLNDHDVILNSFESFFNEKYPPDLREELKSSLDINIIKKEIEKYKDFGEYDRINHFHGKHISKYNGETDYKKILNTNQIKILESNEILNKIINKFYKDNI